VTESGHAQNGPDYGLEARTPVSATDLSVEDLALLEFVPADVRRLVAAGFEPQSHGFGGVIACEGDDTDAFYGSPPGGREDSNQMCKPAHRPLSVFVPG
jgi:hypothetical protein